MPMAHLNTSWTPEELINQAIGIVSDDWDWLVLTQSEGSIVLKRERNISLSPWKSGRRWKHLWASGWKTIFFGVADDQIVISAKRSGEKTKATINFTSGARREVNNLLTAAPKA